MDRYPYLGTLYYLTNVSLPIIGTHHIFYRIFLIHITKYAYQVFDSIAGENWCFMIISILSASLVLKKKLCIFCVVFEFLILFVFFLQKFSG